MNSRRIQWQTRVVWIVVLTLSVTLFCGCFPDWPENSGTAVVHGNILLDGAPVNQANIVFVPSSVRNSNNKLMPLAYGTTDSDGKFELKYSDGTSELLAGNYMVIVSKVSRPDGEQGVTFQPARNGLLPESITNISKFTNEGELIPDIYNRKSKLTYEVIASPSIIRPKFELTSIDSDLDELLDFELTPK